MHTENSARCHAHNRKGNPCRRWAVPGKSVCHYHGGAPGSGAPKGNMNRYVHGLYSRSARVPQRIKERAKELVGVQGLREQIATQRALIEAAVEEGRGRMFQPAQLTLLHGNFPAEEIPGTGTHVGALDLAGGAEVVDGT